MFSYPPSPTCLFTAVQVFLPTLWCGKGRKEFMERPILLFLHTPLRYMPGGKFILCLLCLYYMECWRKIPGSAPLPYLPSLGCHYYPLLQLVHTCITCLPCDAWWAFAHLFVPLQCLLPFWCPTTFMDTSHSHPHALTCKFSWFTLSITFSCYCYCSAEFPVLLPTMPAFSWRRLSWQVEEGEGMMMEGGILALLLDLPGGRRKWG